MTRAGKTTQDLPVGIYLLVVTTKIARITAWSIKCSRRICLEVFGGDGSEKAAVDMSQVCIEVIRQVQTILGSNLFNFRLCCAWLLRVQDGAAQPMD